MFQSLTDPYEQLYYLGFSGTPREGADTGGTSGKNADRKFSRGDAML